MKKVTSFITKWVSIYTAVFGFGIFFVLFVECLLKQQPIKTDELFLLIGLGFLCFIVSGLIFWLHIYLCNKD